MMEVLISNTGLWLISNRFNDILWSKKAIS